MLSYDGFELRVMHGDEENVRKLAEYNIFHPAIYFFVDVEMSDV